MCTQTHKYILIVHMVMRRSVIRYIIMRPYSLDELQYECVYSFLFVQVIHLPVSASFFLFSVNMLHALGDDNDEHHHRSAVRLYTNGMFGMRICLCCAQTSA